MMTTADLSLRYDRSTAHSPALPAEPRGIRERLRPTSFKLTHRDMGPRSRYLGPEVPAEELIWQDPGAQQSIMS